MTRRCMGGAALTALAAALACAHPAAAPGARRTVDVTAGDARLTVSFLPGDEAGAEDVARALPAATVRAERWGALALPVAVTVHPTHGALEAAAGVSGRAWLRGWARLDTLEVQSPRTWWALGAGRAELEDFLAHELAHCVTYQAAGARRPWREHGIPLWFTEGLAMAVAGAASGPLPPEALARWYRDHPGEGVAADEPEGAGEADLAYGAAHLAFGFLLVRYGESCPRRVLDRLRAGAPFPVAFRDAIGLEVEAFEREFRRYVVWEGWRR